MARRGTRTVGWARLMALAALAGLAGCQSFGDNPKYIDFPSYQGEVLPLENPVAVRFDPVGTHRFETKTANGVTLSASAPLDRNTEIRINLDADIGLKMEGLAKIESQAENLLVELVSRHVSVSTKAGNQPAKTHRFKDPALLLTYQLSKSGEVLDFDIDPRSTLLQESYAPDGMDVDIRPRADTVPYYESLTRRLVIEEGDRFPIPLQRFALLLSTKTENKTRLSGEAFWSPIGNTLFENRALVLGRIDGTIDVDGEIYSGQGRVGGFSLVDPQTGLELYSEVVSQATYWAGEVKVTYVRSQVTRFEPSLENIKDFPATIAARPSAKN
ncbi:MAG: hypothetical protein AAF530_21720 [Pseudomonadota bacterium]